MTGPEPLRKQPSGWPRAAGAGLELAGTLVGCCLAGYWLDLKLNTSPWALLILAVLGIVGGLYNMIRRQVREAFLQTAAKKKNESGGDSADGADER